MKLFNINIVFVTLILSTLFSCTKSEMNNEDFNESNFTENQSMLMRGPDDHGISIGVEWNFDKFSFHRPKYSCLRGFWFCFDAEPD